MEIEWVGAVFGDDVEEDEGRWRGGVEDRADGELELEEAGAQAVLFFEDVFDAVGW